jgi:putative ABC transport system permease protein
VRQLLTESLLLALLGGVAGLGFAYAGVRFLQIRPPATGEGLQVIIEPRLDRRVLLFSLFAAIVSAVVSGLIPALQTSKADLVPALKNAEAGQGVRQRMIGRNTLVIAQVALSMVLLTASGMLINGVRAALLSDPGFRTDHILAMQLDTAFVRYTPQQSQDFYKELLNRARTLPGVTAVSLAQNIPFSTGQRGEAVIPEGYQFPKGEFSVGILTSSVDENYFPAMRIPITRGRAFTAHDDEKAPLVAIVNQQFAKTYWPNQDPIGKRLQLGSNKNRWLQVIGVTPTAKYAYLGEPATPYLYVPFAQNPQSRMAILTCTSIEPASLAMPLRQLVHSLDANEPVFNLMTLQDYIGSKNQPVHMLVEIVATMGAIGLSLALIGLYGLVAYSVARRTREIGVRMAIGAHQNDVLKMVLRQGLLLSLIGIGIGGLLAAAVSKALVAGLVGLASASAAVYVIVPLLLLAVTLGACYMPARRAARVDPVAALRAE